MLPAEASVEQELAAACARGDRRAWSELVRRYGRKVHGVVHAVGASGEADDLWQDVWTRLLADEGATLRRFRGCRAGALQVFLGQIARRVAIDHVRSQRQRGRVLENTATVASGAPGPFEILRSAARGRELAAALDAIASVAERPGQVRDVLRLYFEQGWLPAEIAAAGVGLSRRGVESILRRAKAKLAKLLADDDP